MGLSAIGKLALEEHLPLLKGGSHATRHGWTVDMDWEAGVCHVGLACPYVSSGQETVHQYMLRLTFEHYNLEQPGVIFVNPETREIGTPGEFERWWPSIDGNPWINIQIDTGTPAKSYLCFQWTQEWKQTHGPIEQTDPKKWDPEKHTVIGVVATIQRALLSAHYKGYRKS